MGTWQALWFGRHIWENITEERLRAELARTWQPAEIERKMENMKRTAREKQDGATESALSGYFRFWPDDKPGNSSL